MLSRLLLPFFALHAVAASPKYVESPAANFTVLSATANVTVVSPHSQFGTWEGWGVSLCWWANIFGQHDELADLAFSLKNVTIGGTSIPGLGLNIARYNAGGSSWAKAGSDSMVASKNIPHWKQIQGFWNDWGSDKASSSSWNWTADGNQIEMLKKAHARGANHLELFSNSPMWWMLSNHNPSGNGGSDNLESWNRANHSKYMAIVAEYAKDHWGLEFTSVEPLNEPIASWWKSDGTQEGCHFDHSTQAEAVQDLHEELAQRGLSAVVSASDENTYDQARATWKAFDSTTKSKVGKVNVHGYQGSGGRRDLLYQDVAGKRLWNSEYGDGDATGMSMASNLNLDIKWLHNTAWCYWQFLDESGGWGLLKFDSKTMTVGQPNKKYSVLAQYTRHVREGMTMIDGGEANTVAAYDARKRLLVLVTTNYGPERWITHDLTRFSAVSGPITRWSTSTDDDGPNYLEQRDVGLSGKTFSVYFSANSVHTFEIEGVGTDYLLYA